MTKLATVIIYSDGACSGNPGWGGWGVLLKSGKHIKEIYNGEAATTNNRMELTAAIEGLSALKRSSTVEIYTDSEYVRKGITQWLTNWQQNGWKTAGKKPVKNKDLWEKLVDASEKHTVNWHWVKGHAGDPGNEKADELARKGLELARSSNAAP